MGLRFFVSPFAAGEMNEEESECAEVLKDEVSNEPRFLVVFRASIWTCKCQECLSMSVYSYSSIIRQTSIHRDMGKNAHGNTINRYGTSLQSIPDPIFR